MVSAPGPGLRVLGGGPLAGAPRLAAALLPGSGLLAVAGSAADPRSAGDVSDTVVSVLDALQALSTEAADEHRPADVVVAIITPAQVDPAHEPWRRALDEAVTGITQSLTLEYVPDVLRVNAVLGDAADPDDLVASVEFYSHADGAFAVGTTLDVRP